LRSDGAEQHDQGAGSAVWDPALAITPRHSRSADPIRHGVKDGNVPLRHPSHYLRAHIFSSVRRQITIDTIRMLFCLNHRKTLAGVCAAGPPRVRFSSLRHSSSLFTRIAFRQHVFGAAAPLSCLIQHALFFTLFTFMSVPTPLPDAHLSTPHRSSLPAVSLHFAYLCSLHLSTLPRRGNGPQLACIVCPSAVLLADVDAGHWTGAATRGVGYYGSDASSLAVVISLWFTCGDGFPPAHAPQTCRHGTLVSAS